MGTLPGIVALVLAAAIGYLIGSIPVGFLLVKIFTGEDIRQHGSGRTGGTNVGRRLGTWALVLTAILDGVKGFLAVLAMRLVLNQIVPADLTSWTQVLAGIAAVVGHNWSLFLGFRGGAGTSPALGAAAALWGWSLAFAAVFGAAALLIFSMASVGSMVAVLTLVVVFAVRALAGGPWGHVVYALAATALVFYALAPNIRRLREGTERRLWFGLRREARPRQ